MAWDWRKCEICGINKNLRDTFLARFPLDKERCKAWIRATGKEELVYIPVQKLHQSKFICGDHFAPKSYKKRQGRLKRNAVPSLKLHTALPDELVDQFPINPSSVKNKIEEGVIPIAPADCSPSTSQQQSRQEIGTTITRKTPMLLREETRDMVYKVYCFMKNESIQGVDQKELKKVQERTAKATGISLRSVRTIVSEYSDSVTPKVSAICSEIDSNAPVLIENDHTEVPNTIFLIPAKKSD